MTLIVNIGHYGGFYKVFGNGTYRICLGWLAITFCAFDFDKVLEEALIDKYNHKESD